MKQTAVINIVKNRIYYRCLFHVFNRVETVLGVSHASDKRPLTGKWGCLTAQNRKQKSYGGKKITNKPIVKNFSEMGPSHI